MNRAQLEHIVRASAGITGASEFVIIGSQAVLGQFPNAPKPLVDSMELDIFTLRSEEDAVLIDGSIGEHSPFHDTFGVWAHGVAKETATLPIGWQARLISVHSPSTGGATARCLEVHDLAVSKLVAGREKDIQYVSHLMRLGWVDEVTMRLRIAETGDESLQGNLGTRFAKCARMGRTGGSPTDC